MTPPRFSSDPITDRPIRVMVVGAGMHSTSSHGPALRDCAADAPGEVELVAVCDLDRDKAAGYAKAFGFAQARTDLDAALSELPCDALVAVTPMDLTASMAQKLLAHGRPVVIEKPPGRTLAEAREVLAAARSHGTAHMVSHNRRFGPAVQALSRWLADRVDRPPRLVWAKMLRPDRRDEHFIPHTGVHALDLVVSWLGRPVSVRTRRMALGIPDDRSAVHADIGFAGGASAEVLIAPRSGANQETYHVLGPGYSAHVDVMAGRLVVHDGGELVLDWQTPPDTPPHVRGGALGETRAFIQAVRNGTGYAPDLYDAVTVVELAEAIEHSEQTDLTG